MGAFIAAAVALGALVVAMTLRPRARVVPPSSGSSSPGGGGAAPPAGGDLASTLIGAGATVAGVVVPLVTGGGATAGGVAAGGGTTAAVAGGAGGGTTAAVGGAGGGTTAVISGGGTTALVTGASSAGISAGSIIGASSPALIVMLFIIADRITKAMEQDKDWQGYALNLNPSALALNRFESDMTQEVLKQLGIPFAMSSVRDGRLDRRMQGQQVVSVGFREIVGYRYTPPGPAAGLAPPPRNAGTGTLPPPLPKVPIEHQRMWKALRTQAFEFLRFRAFYGYRLIRGWNILPNPPANFGWTNEVMYTLYNSLEPGYGGLMSVPAAANGDTVLPRINPSEPWPPLMEAHPDAYLMPDYSLVSDEDRKVLRLMALIDVMKILRWDPRNPGSASDYAASCAAALNYGNNVLINGQAQAATGITSAGDEVWCDASVFAVNYKFNPSLIRIDGPGGFNSGGLKAGSQGVR